VTILLDSYACLGIEAGAGTWAEVVHRV